MDSGADSGLFAAGFLRAALRAGFFAVAFFAVRDLAPRFAGFRDFAAPRFAPAFLAGRFAGFRAAFLAGRLATRLFAVDFLADFFEPAFFAVFFFLAAGFFFAAGFFAGFFLAVAIAFLLYKLRKYNMALPLQLLLQLLISRATHAISIPAIYFLLATSLSASPPPTIIVLTVSHYSQSSAPRLISDHGVDQSFNRDMTLGFAKVSLRRENF